VPAVTAAVVLAGGGVAYALTQNGGASAPTAATGAITPAGPLTGPTVDPTSAPSTPSATASATSRPTHRPAASRHPARPRRTPPALAVSVSGSACWLEVTTADGRRLVRRTLHPGQHLSFPEHDLRLIIGNAGALRLSVDGHHGYVAGRPGQVRFLTIK